MRPRASDLTFSVDRRRAARSLALALLWFLLFAPIAPMADSSAEGAADPQAPGTPPGSTIDVVIRDGMLTLDARDAPLAEVIRRIGEVGGFETVIAGDLSTPVTHSFAGVPVKDGIERLVGDITRVVIYAPSAGEAPPPLKELRLYAVAAPDVGDRGPGVSASVDPDILAELEDPDVGIRIEAVRKLSRLNGAVVVDALAGVLRSDEDSRVRARAATALGGFADERAVPALETAVGDETQSVRIQALRALGRVGGDRATRILGEVLLGGSDVTQRVVAAWGLGRDGGEAARSMLTAAAADPSSMVSSAASRALNNLPRSE